MQPASPLASNLPNLDAFLEALSGAQLAAFGKSHLGARERARAAHLVQTLCGVDQPPASIKGALRASLTGSEAAAQVFDAVWLQSPLVTELRSTSPAQIEVTDSLDEQTTIDEPRPGLTFFNIISIVAAVLSLAGLAFTLITMNRDDDAAVTEQAPIGFEGVPEAARPLAPLAEAAAPTASVSPEGIGSSDNHEAQVYENKARALLELTVKYNHRPSPRQLALILSRSSLGRGRDEFGLAREIAKATGKGPDIGIDMLASETFVRILTVLGEPPGSTVRIADQLAGPLSEAMDQLVASLAQPLIYEGKVSGAALSPDQTHILTWSEDNTARVWDFATGLPVGAPLQHDGPVIGAQFTDSAAKILTLSGNEALLWNVAGEARTIAKLQHDSPVSGAAVSHDSSRILTWSGDNNAHLWNARTGARIGSPLPHDSSVFGGTFWNDRLQPVTWSVSVTSPNPDFGFFSSELNLWTVGSGGEYARDSHTRGSKLLAADWLEDRSRLVFLFDNSVLTWDVNSGGKPEAIFLRPHPELVLGAAISKNGTRILVWDQDNVVRLSDAETGDPIGSGLPHPSKIEGAVFSDDGSHILTWSADRTARLWEAGTSQQIGPDLPHASSVSNASLSKDGSRVFTLSDDGTVMRWSPRGVSDPAALGETRRKLSKHQLWPALLIAAIPVLIAGVSLAHPAAWRRAYLRRRRFEPGSMLTALSTQLRNSVPLIAERRAVAQLDRRRRAPSRRLDARETALASARANGFFTPVTDTDAGTAEYVALIERRRRGDADALRMTAFFERLRKSGLTVSVYSYSGTPEALTPARNLRPITLETLKHRHKGAYLFISGEPQAFHDAEAGGAAGWTRRIGRIGRDEGSSWSGAALLVRAGAEIPAFLARLLNTDLSIAIRPAIAAGLNGLAQSFDKGSPTDPTVSARAAFERMPEFLASDPGRLMRETPRYPIDQQRLIFELDDWVGPTGLIWLRALAYYPIVQWDLARCLRDLLLPDLSSEEREILESKVARLVWLEQGYMPDWVRQGLIESNDPQSEKRTIELLTQIMTAAQSGEQGQVTFELGGRKDGRAATHPADALFIDAVARTRVRPWDLPPPAAWQANMPGFLKLPWVRIRVAIVGVVLAATAFLLMPRGIGAPVSEWLAISVFVLGVCGAVLTSKILSNSLWLKPPKFKLDFNIARTLSAAIAKGRVTHRSAATIDRRLAAKVSQPTEHIEYRIIGTDLSISIISTEIEDVRQIDAWIIPDLQMGFNPPQDDSISSLVRYHGAKRNARGQVLEDTITKQVIKKIGKRGAVEHGTIITTKPGRFADRNNVKLLFHIATVDDELSIRSPKAQDFESYVSRVLTEIEKHNADLGKRRKGDHLRSVLLSPFEPRNSGVEPSEILSGIAKATIELLRRDQGSLEQVALLAKTRAELKHLHSALTLAGGSLLEDGSDNNKRLSVLDSIESDLILELQDFRPQLRNADIIRFNFRFDDTGRTISILTGDVLDVSDIDAWVIPEDSRMGMGPQRDQSFSARIKHLGAERNARDEVVADTITRELSKKLGGQKFSGVEPGAVIMTGPGKLKELNDVQLLAHVAIHQREASQGYSFARSKFGSMFKVFEEIDEYNHKQAKRRKGPLVQSVLIPPMEAWGSKGDDWDIHMTTVVIDLLRANLGSEYGVKKVTLLVSTAADMAQLQATIERSPQIEISTAWRLRTETQGHSLNSLTVY